LLGIVGQIEHPAKPQHVRIVPINSISGAVGEDRNPGGHGRWSGYTGSLSVMLI
jgi:hypothetical protein